MSVTNETNALDDRLRRLLSVVNDPHVGVRCGVVAALGVIGPAAIIAVPHLIVALCDSSRDVRKETAKALGLIGPAAAAAVPALVQGLRDESRLVRKESAKALGLLGSTASIAVSALIATLYDEDSDAQVEAAKAIGMIGGEVSAATPALIKQLSDHKLWAVRRACAKTLGLVGKRSPDIIVALKAATLDADPNVRTASMTSLKALALLP